MYIGKVSGNDYEVIQDLGPQDPDEDCAPGT